MNYDERTQQVAGQSAMVMLGLTQIALGVILMIRLYVFDQPDEELRDIQWVLLGSIVGYFALRSFLGGTMPVPTAKQAVMAYVGLTLSLVTVLSLWLGLPDLSEWTTNILPAIVGPAITVGGYWAISASGRRRVERKIADSLE